MDKMQVKPSTQPVILATPVGLYPGAAAPSSQQLRDAVFSALMRMKVPSVCTVNQEVLSLFASRRTSGILVNIGHKKTQVFPILRGRTLSPGVVSIKIGGSDLTVYLFRQLVHRNVGPRPLRGVSLLKKNLCYVALDYEAELRKKDTEASFETRPGHWYTLKQERFQTGEILFQPHIEGSCLCSFWFRQSMGLHQAVAHCIERQAERSPDYNWYKTIVLAGGTANLPGLAERLDKELHNLLPPNISQGICVITSPYDADAVWHGGKWSAM
ncbi:hypothetical protein OSB04_026873 [Centaurea solstitialis]|uniref:Actin-related protein 8 n=1 Tax=Centaurea solstitialis TaxID=347529 RepID=A0AA38VW34_9ASTR|nr:hypothetical protein OSB04_026873 [Centaurea solstitialis]